MATRYVPAAGRVGSTRMYDRSIAVTMREAQWRPPLRARVLSGVPHGGNVVDVGAGTGTLAIALAADRPDVTVTRSTAMPRSSRSRRPSRAPAPCAGDRAWPDDLPLERASADAVVISLVLHHLDRDTKQRALREIARVLRPGGRLHIADWGRPATPLLRASFFLLQILDGFDGTRDHAAGRIPQLVRAAGLRDVRVYRRLRAVWGTLELLEARKGD